MYSDRAVLVLCCKIAGSVLQEINGDGGID